MFDPAKAERVLVYGGAFDPPHAGHVRLPFEVADMVGADGVVYVPTGNPPHKAGPIASGRDRVAMLRIALAESGKGDRATVCEYEVGRSERSYTVRTLEHLRGVYGEGVELGLLIGGDAAAGFYNWYEPGRVMELADAVVMVRPGAGVEEVMGALPVDLPAAERETWRGRFVEAGLIDISSTRLRELLRERRYDDELVKRGLSAGVIDYIRERGLYV